MVYQSQPGARRIGAQGTLTRSARSAGEYTRPPMEENIIAAIATPLGRGGICVIRISGPRLDSLLGKLVDDAKAVSPRSATLADFRNAAGDLIDRGLILFFPAPHSYTGEDVIELQGHGGIVVAQLLLQRCLDLGARLAEPGEFTKRAFLNNRIDLAQAESVADLIEATTAEAVYCAARSMQGEFSREIAALVAALIELRTRVEASLDFPEEDDILAPERAWIEQSLEKLGVGLQKLLAAACQGNLLREGVRMVLAGHPNVGKSSLLNRLAGEDLAIVTDIPGTTRDAIRQGINIDGVPFYIIDTAGLREPKDTIENIGISITWDEISKSDMVLWICDAMRMNTETTPPDIWKELPERASLIKVRNKIDLTGDQPMVRTPDEILEVNVSAKTGAGIDLLRATMLDVIGLHPQHEQEGVYMARTRHLRALQTAAGHLANAATQVRQLDLLAEELHSAQRALMSITGEFTVDDLLGEIFSRFCVGK